MFKIQNITGRNSLSKNLYIVCDGANRKELTCLSTVRRSLRRSSYGVQLRKERISRLAALQLEIASELAPKLAIAHSAESYAITGGKDKLENQGAIESDSLEKYLASVDSYSTGTIDNADIARENEPFSQALKSGMDKAESTVLHV